MNACIEHTEAAQAAEFSAARTVEAVTWSRMEWWSHSQGASLVVNQRDATGFGFPTVVGEIFAPRFARRATAADAVHFSRC